MIRISVGPQFHLRYLLARLIIHGLNNTRNFHVEQNLFELLRNQALNLAPLTWLGNLRSVGVRILRVTLSAFCVW